jgi:hypothetical protein
MKTKFVIAVMMLFMVACSRQTDSHANTAGINASGKKSTKPSVKISHQTTANSYNNKSNPGNNF